MWICLGERSKVSRLFFGFARLRYPYVNKFWGNFFVSDSERINLNFYRASGPAVYVIYGRSFVCLRNVILLSQLTLWISFCSTLNREKLVACFDCFELSFQFKMKNWLISLLKWNEQGYFSLGTKLFDSQIWLGLDFRESGSMTSRADLKTPLHYTNNCSVLL